MPKMIAITIANSIASKTPTWSGTASAVAIPSRSEENRAPTPVRAMTPTIKPAAAHTAIIWIDISAPSLSALRIALGPMRNGVSQLIIAAAAVARVPARITE